MTFLRNNTVILCTILLLAFTLRFYNILGVPAGFFCDEAGIGYNAYTILHTGRDEYGKWLPLAFRSFGDFKPPLAIYSTVPFILLFGLTELAPRLQSLLYGMVTIFALYLLGKETVSKKLGLWAAFIAATMPWLIHYNRIGFDNSIYPAFFVFAIFLLLKSVENKKYIFPFFSILGLTLYTYQPARLTVFLFLPCILFLYKKTFLMHKRESLIGLIMFFIVALPLLVSFGSGEGFARFNQVSLFSIHLPFSKLLIISLSHYFLQLTPSYLFITGEPTRITRHFTQGLLPLLPATAIFLLAGVYKLIKERKEKFFQLLIVWLIIYPIGGAVVLEGPFTNRDIIGAPLFALLIALGIIESSSWLKDVIPHTKRSLILTVGIAALILLDTVFFLQFYFLKYPMYSSGFWGWQYGPKYIVKYFSEVQNKYDDEFMQPIFNAPEIFFKFYAPTDCQKCKLGTPDTLLNPQRKQLFAITPDYLTEHSQFHFSIKKIIYYPDGEIAFMIGEVR